MIVGTGIDIVSIERVQKLLEKYGDNLTKRILSKEELSIYFNKSKERRLYFLSNRFASKESVSKALGVGIGKPYRFKDIEILNDKSGKPYVNFLCHQEFVNKKYHFNISISDEKRYAIAFAIISM